MNQKTDSKHLYSILFWAVPKSGFDIAKKYIVLNMFKEIMDEVYTNDPFMEAKFKQFENESSGYALYDEIIESDTSIVDPETEAMPIIRKRYPEARYIVMLPINLSN